MHQCDHKQTINRNWKRFRFQKPETKTREKRVEKAINNFQQTYLYLFNNFKFSIIFHLAGFVVAGRLLLFRLVSRRFYALNLYFILLISFLLFQFTFVSTPILLHIIIIEKSDIYYKNGWFIFFLLLVYGCELGTSMTIISLLFVVFFLLLFIFIISCRSFPKQMIPLALLRLLIFVFM